MLIMSTIFFPLMSAFNFSTGPLTHERMLMSGERKIILFNLYDQILLQAYFGPFRLILDEYGILTFYDPTGYLIPIFGLKYRFLTLLTPLRAISDLI
jgi:hypothetical protein